MKLNLRDINPKNLDKKWLVLFLVLALSIFPLRYGVTEAWAAKQKYAQTQEKAQEYTRKAANFNQVKKQLDASKESWLSLTQRYNSSIDGSSFYNLMHQLAKENKVTDIDIKNTGESMLYENRIKAVCFDITMKGNFPSIYGVLHGIEFSQLPAEIKPVVITEAKQDTASDKSQTDKNTKAKAVKKNAADSNITVNVTAVLYSMNPAESYEYIGGKSGKYDPFFDPQVIVPDDTENAIYK